MAVAALALGIALAAPAAAPTDRSLRGGITSLRFDAEILSDLGIELALRSATESPLREHALGFPVDPGASRVTLAARGSDFEGFAAADLRHAGGFALRVRGTQIDLAGFRLVESEPPHVLELRDARGARWLFVDKPHALLTSALLSLKDADLVIAPELAVRLGRPDLAGSYIGVLDAQLSFDSASAAAPVETLGGACVGDFSQPVDLLMLTLSGMTQAAREPGGRVALAPNATVRNLGPGDVEWYRSIAPASPVGPHPFLALGFYRLSGGVLEQIGRGDVKHTFFATNTACDCPGAQILYAGCEDLYGVSTNLDRGNLGPRDEIDAFAVSWSSLGSHFDGIPVDNSRSHFGDGAHDSFEHRLVVREPDLQTASARYFYDGWYMAPNDSDLENSMGRREVDPAFAGSTWSFPTIDSGTANGSILDVLVDPQNVQPGQATELHDTGAGRVHLVAVSTALGGGQFHYEYALMNYDFARQIRSFSVPIAPGQSVSNLGFGDANGNPLDDWSASVVDLRVTWSAPAGNELDWGTLYNFRLNVDAAPVETAIGLVPLEAGHPGAIGVRSLPEPGSGASIGSATALLALLERRRRASSLRAAGFRSGLTT